MTESTDHAADSPGRREVVARTDHDGIAVRKVATTHGSEAVAVYFNVRSNRSDQCTVRIADAIPQPLHDNEVEFHPKYDPVNWRRAEGTVVYESAVPPDANHTTVYGIVVEDPGQLELFSAEPAVEVDSGEPSEATAQPRREADPFSFGTSEAAEPLPDQSSEQPATTRPGQSSSGTEDGGRDDSGLVESLVSELEQRDLTEAERRALRDALVADPDEVEKPRLETLRQEVEALRDEIAAVDRRAADFDRLESQVEALSSALDRRFASVADDIEALQRALDRETRWRSQLQDSIEFDPGTE